MASYPDPPNPAAFATYSLPLARISPHTLVRVSSHSTNEPHFSDSRAGRFSDPSNDAKRYRTCYFGFKLATAFAETVLHDAVPSNGSFLIAQGELTGRYVHTFHGSAALVLANLTGAGLKKLGLDGYLSASPSDVYELSQKWAKAIYDHPKKVDGIQYISRHLNTQKAVVLFDRSSHKLTSAAHVRLAMHPELGRVLKLFSATPV